jgi:3-isopropylmalate dehydrogenase
MLRHFKLASRYFEVVDLHSVLGALKDLYEGRYLRPDVYVISLIPGDGIGPEITSATLEVIKKVVDVYGIRVDVRFVEAGDKALSRYGQALPQSSIDTIKKSHTCLKAPVGETSADVIVRLRIMLDLFANIRPVKSYPSTQALRGDIDLVVVRENTEDLYKGLEFYISNNTAVALRVITYEASKRIAEVAFKIASGRRKKVTAVHKSNVLRHTCGLFVKACRDVARNYPDVTYEEQYVDACAANLVRKPQDFDVIVTTNMFGDILSDEAAQVAGSLGLAPSCNLGYEYAIFEPIHGAAFDIAGKGIANPISMILSAALMFEWLGIKYSDDSCIRAAKAINDAVYKVLSEGKVLTPDLGGSAKTYELANAIASKIA